MINTVDKKLEQVSTLLDMLAEDTSVPRNIRKGAKDSKERLFGQHEALDLRCASVVSILEELSNDPNIPLHARTLIWNATSILESIK
ncbi:MAG: UPF0147 family protein [Candidatus Thermoplasmatota archaeon]|nr:UPF0147 family protein [Candidatus Thermoplasmatota archaeon]